MISQEVRITLGPDSGEPQELILSYPLDPDHEQTLRDIHENGNVKGLIECRMHDDDPALRDMRSADGRLHGAWLLIREISDPIVGKRLILAHWPNTGVTGSHAVPSRMTPEHRARQEYIALRGDACGYGIELEKRLANGFRPDVILTGAVQMAAEVQLSDITTATVRRRTAKAAEFGITSTWFARRTEPVWAYKAPHVETNDRDGFAPGSWRVSTGPRVLEHERCRPGSRLGDCPDGHRNYCGGWHQLWRPIPGLAVDDIIEQVPAGRLVRLDTQSKQGIVLVRPTDRDNYVPPIPQQRGSRRHPTLIHPQYSATRLRQRIQDDEETTPPSPSPDVARRIGPPCRSCGQELLIVRPDRSQCEKCRLAELDAAGA